MKKIFTLVAAVVITGLIFGQVPQKMSYQAVVRDAGNVLVMSHNIGMRISILRGSPGGVVVYTETQTPVTNANGLVSIEIGGDIGFDAINWSNDAYFIKTETDPTGGTSYTITGISQLLSVPYALHAKTAENGFSGSYPDLTNKPVLFDGQYNSLTGLPVLFDGNFNSLINKPVLSSVSSSGSYIDLIDKPLLFDGQYSSLTGRPALFDGQYSSLTGLPVLFDGNYSSLTNKPVLSTVSSSGSYNDLTDKPLLFNGSWTSLTDKPVTVSGYGITDAMTTVHAANGITATNILNWNSAFNWGDHSAAGYLKSYVETDPKVGVNAEGYSPKWDGSAMVTGSMFQDGSGKVGVGTTSPKAAMDITSTTNGFLVPRMTTSERDLIAGPALGLQIFNITTNCFNVWNGSAWGQICPDCGFIPVSGNNGPICAGLSLDLTAVLIPGATYSWNGPNGFTSDQQNPVIPNATTAASGVYSVTASLNGCVSKPVSTVATVTPSLGATSATYNTPVCTNTTLTFSSTTIPGASYTWSGPNNFFSNIQNPSIPNIQAAQAGTYYITATMGNCSSSTSVNVEINPVPAQPGMITGTASLLPPQTNVAYSIAGVSGTTSYTWAYSGNGATINGQGTNSITINFACGATGGNLTVRANNICSGSGLAQSMSIMIATLAQPEVISGASSVVLPQSGIAYSVPAVAGATSYIWTVPGTLGTIASGSGTNSITVNYACGATGGVISVAAVNGCGSGLVRTLPVSITTLSTPGTISGSGTITFPQAGVAYSVPVVAGATTYTWNVPAGATISSGQGSNSIMVNYACGALSGNLSVTANNSCGSGGTNSMSITVTTSAPATPGAISGTNSLPAGVTGVAYSIVPVTGATSYVWTVPTGGIIASGQGTASIIVNYSCSAVSGDISVASVNDCGTSSVRTFAIAVTGTPAQPGTITGLASVPAGSRIVAYSIATVTGATTYTWSYTGTGATIASGQGTNSINVDFDCASAGGNISVTANNSCGSPGAARTLAVSITPTIPTPGTITGTATPLFGQKLTPFTVPLVNGATVYTWTVPSGATINSGQGTNTILADFDCAAVNGNITVAVNNTCIGTGTPATKAITMSSSIAQPGTITGVASVPQGKTGVAYSVVEIAGATSYVWSYTGTGGIVKSGQGTASAVFDFACNATSGNISVTAGNACIAQGTARTLAVTVNTLATPGAITGLATVPQGSTGINYTIAPIEGATSYAWIVPVGATVVSGQGSVSILVDFSCTAGSGNILVTANNACGSSGGSSMNITLTSTLTANAIGGVPDYYTTIGTTDAVYSTTPATGAVSYFWTVPTGGVIKSGQGTNLINVEYSCATPTQSSPVTVIAKNNCISSAPYSKYIYVSGYQNSGITGLASIPKGSSGITYSHPPVKGATYYTWNVPSGAVITSGQGTNLIVVDFSCTASSGNITVVPNTTCLALTSPSIAITTTSAISPLGVITGTTSPMFGQSSVPYSIVPVTGVNKYTWSLPGDAKISSGQGTASILVDFPCSSTNGTIVVSADNNCLSAPPVSLSFALSSAAIVQPGGITGASSVPKGASGIVYSVTAVTGATTYTWTVPANAVIMSGQGTSTVSVDYTDCSVSSGNVSVTASNGCVAGSPVRTLAVTVTSAALVTPGTITGSQTPVPGQTGFVYSIVPVTGATSYTWSYSGTGVTIASGQGTASVVLDFGCGSTNGNISVTASNGCLVTSPARTLAITLGNSLASAGTITGSQGPVFGQTGIIYSVYPLNGATSFTWVSSPGANIVSGQGTRSIVVDFSCTAQINGTISVYASNSCGVNSVVSPLSYVMNGSLSVPGSITGPASVAKGTSDVFYSVAPMPGAATYTWSVPGGCTIKQGQGSNSIKVDFSCSAVSGNITVSAGNSCTTTSASTLAITVASTLPTPGAITGVAAPGLGSSINYSLFAVAGATSYNWTAPAGATLLSGGGTNSVWYSFACGASNGNISVTVNNSCIVAGTAANLAIAPASSSFIRTLGPITETITGNSTRQYSVLQVGDATYTWSVPAGVTIVSGQGSPVVNINYTGTISDNIGVTASNSCLSQSSSSNLAINLTSCALFTANGTGPTGSLQTFTIPAGVTSITIEAYGAQGGNTYSATLRGGKGAKMKGTFAVTPGDVLKILVGQQGTGSASVNYGGGGGGTFVATGTNNPLIVAGGGGGANSPSALNGLDGQATISGGVSSRGISGGTDGKGGSGGQGGGGGGGFYTDGAFGINCCYNPGLSFLNGGTGASWPVGTDNGFGGYGGGGSGDGACCGLGGAGGGYSGGGAGGTTCGQGINGGGGSYNAGTSQSNTSGVHTGDGRVLITW